MKPSRRSIRSHLTYANVTSSLALFLVIAGGAAFAATAAKNSVTSKSIKNDAVKSKDLKDGKAVTGVDVVDDSLKGADIDETSLTLPAGSPPIGAAGGALSGAYPNPGLADGAVGTANIADAAITAAKLAGGAVGTAKLTDAAVTAAKLAPDAVTSGSIAPNSLTASDIGPSAVGNNELAPIVLRASANVVVPPGESRNASASCNSGEVAISATTRWQSGAPSSTDDLTTVHSGVSSAGQDPTQVFGRGRNDTGSNANWQVLAVCLAP